MTDTVALKGIPFAGATFRDIQRCKLALVDKTRYIELLEKYCSEFPHITRPRGFGKTLFTQMLEAYYDEKYAGEFEENFAGTYIGEHKTALASSFRVIHFDFSGLSSSPNIIERFSESVRTSIETFFSKYPHPCQERILDRDFPDSSSLLEAFFGILGDVYDAKLYVIIDEYDQFANEILSSDVNRFRDITSKEGFYKDFFTTLKKGTAGIVARIFITGVSMVCLDSMTSGFNIADKISTSMCFAGMFGFNETELRNFIPQVVNLEECGLEVDTVVAHMKEWYNGYRFSSRSVETVFNPAMCLCYLNALMQGKAEPSVMADSNLGKNIDIVKGILSLGNPILVKDILDKALKNIPIPFDEDASELKLNLLREMGERELLSALFYMGFLTYDGGEESALCIPNRTIRTKFSEFKNLSFTENSRRDRT